jgi:NADH:ubiquinone oxidoreductase subunit F (NADH-binding)/Pyruvate/2-oxoacid:ferredoxin oxidoreductase delta subunit
MPRPRPPFPTESGLWGYPTNINNVETWANVPPIINRGGEWFASIGTAGSRGTKVFALTGKIRNTGLVEVPMGIPLREVIFGIGGGIPDGKKFKAVQLGGPSGGCVPEHLLDTPVDYESIRKTGAIMGSGGMVVMDETTCMVDIARFFMSFVQDESCGKCIPCREGTKRMLEILDRITMVESEKSQADELRRFNGAMLLENLASVISDTSLCGLGQTAANPVISTLRYFRDEYEAHIYDRKCPAGVCRRLLTYRIDNTKCAGCGLCATKCPQGAILGEKRQAHYIVDERCIRCDACRQVCNFGAVLAE